MYKCTEANKSRYTESKQTDPRVDRFEDRERKKHITEKERKKEGRVRKEGRAFANGFTSAANY